MAFTRTRIWHGGDANFGLEGGAQEPGAAPLAPAPESPGGQQTQAGAGLPTISPDHAADAHYIPGFAPGAGREQAATRFLPIEELFPELAADANSQEPPRARDKERQRVDTPTGLRRPLPRRWPIMALALAGLVLGATYWSSGFEVDAPPAREGAAGAHEGAAPLRAGATTTSAVRASRPPGSPGELDPPAARVTAPQSVGEAVSARALPPSQDASQAASRSPARAHELPPGLERAAIDALIAGDFARAEKLYARLATGAPPEAIREALRILSSRQDAPSP